MLLALLSGVASSTPADHRPVHTPRSAAWVATLVAAGMLLLQVLWMLSTPPAAGIDESDHVYRASAVQLGHWQPGTRAAAGDGARGFELPVRADLAHAARVGCRVYQYRLPQGCPAIDRDSAAPVWLPTAAATYNPAFYWVVGNVAAPWHGYDGLLAMRLASALLCALMVAAAIWSTCRWAHSGWPLLAVLVAVTPTTVYSTAVVAPNGLELVAGVTLWSAGLGLTRVVQARLRRQLLAVAVLAAVVMIVCHSLGALWVLLTLVALGLHDRDRLRPLLQHRRSLALASGAVLLTVAASAAWILAAGTNDPHHEGGDPIPGSPFPHIFSGLLLWPLQAIAAFPARGDVAPLGVYVVVLALGATLLALALRWGTSRRPERVTLAAVALASVVVPMGLTVLSFTQVGLSWQGRYGMPFSVGMILLLGAWLDRSDLPTRLWAVLAALAAVMLPVCHVAGAVRSATVFTSRTDLPASVWTAPPLFLLLLLASAAALLWLLASRAWCRFPR